jgi:phage shock protein A
MPIPLLLWGAAAALAATGVVKGVQASNMMDEAKEIGEKAERKHRRAAASLDEVRGDTQGELEQLGKLKVTVFTHQIRHLIEAIKRTKSASSKLQGFQEEFSIEKIKAYEKMILSSLELEKGIASGAVGGALAAMGAYGAVGTLATASTGAAITGLSGVAATNATLAWLGGGALSAGGFGMAGGMLAMGGIVLGPALAIGGFMMASKAEEALTEANAYKAQVSVAVAKMQAAETAMEGIVTNVKEISNVITELARRFDQIKVADDRDPVQFQRMLAMGTALKKALDVAIINKDGVAIDNIRAKCSGLMAIA